MKLVKYVLFPIFIVLVTAVIVGFALSILEKRDPQQIGYKVLKTWKLPPQLDEISGISWISKDEIACVQDENGYIFIYDLAKSKVTDTIKFADEGDYEGIAIKGRDAYVMRSDGILYEVLRFRESEITINTYNTGFTYTNNMETLAYDPVKNMLITIPKERDLNDDDGKYVYEIQIDSGAAVMRPRFEINMNDPLLKDFKKNKLLNTFSPSDIAIHPKTKDYYVLEGMRPKLVVLDREGTMKKVYLFNWDIVPQPEGLTINKDGSLYVSTETGGSYAAILQIELLESDNTQ